MTRDQADAHVIIWAAILGIPALIILALAWARARPRDVIAACTCDTGRTPTPAEIADAIAIRDAEESWDRLTKETTPMTTDQTIAALEADR